MPEKLKRYPIIDKITLFKKLVINCELNCGYFFGI